VAEADSGKRYDGISRLKLFLALSRTPHGLLDMCTPAFAALLALGRFPPPATVAIGLVTTFAGYTAVYALNDIVDYPSDRERVRPAGSAAAPGDLDGAIVRQPLAAGLLSLREALAWAGFWCAVALAGAWRLNPVCVAIFAGGCLLEAVYCRLWRVSPYRALVSGAVKSSGAVAAVFAVDPHPSAAFVAALFGMLFFWEIGGQNIPNDLADIDEDRRFRARTLPIAFGPARAVVIAAGALAATLVLTVAVFQLSALPSGRLAALPALAGAAGLMAPPAAALFRLREGRAAMVLFNRASFFPAALLAAALCGVAI
jgi:4-hydroxybenzoate polyprenyltransferase